MNYKLDGALKVNRHEDGKCIIVSGIFDSTDGRERFMLTAYKFKGENKVVGYEYYKGENYIVDDNTRSYSRNYKSFKELPMKYHSLVWNMTFKLRSEINKGW